MISQDITLCADDYSQNEAICAGIIFLLQKKRINAVSCLVNVPNWYETYQDLNQYKTSAKIGLHLNLTLGSPISNVWKSHYGYRFHGLTALIRKCYLEDIKKQVLAAEINAQVEAFTQVMGMDPDFIDGHQHIHQLPQISDVLIEQYRQQQWTSSIRNTGEGLRDYFSLTGFPKRQIIGLLCGGTRFRNRLIKQEIATNSSFAGIYNFNRSANYRHYFKQFLRMSRGGGLIVCHPGLASKDNLDPLVNHRYHEFNYLASDMFLQDVEKLKTRK